MPALVVVALPIVGYLKWVSWVDGYWIQRFNWLVLFTSLAATLVPWFLGTLYFLGHGNLKQMFIISLVVYLVWFPALWLLDTCVELLWAVSFAETEKDLK